MAFRKALGGLTFCTLLGGGTAFSYKQNLISQRRRDLVEERQRLEDELSHVRSQVHEDEAVLQAKLKKLDDFESALDTLWADRLERYAQANRDATSFLQILPEAMGALKGLTNHYQYMTNELRQFIGFDVAASKVHNLALLVKGLDENGIKETTEVLGKLFAAEPLIGEVCYNANRFFSSDEVPNITAAKASLHEISSSFGFVMAEMEDALSRASKRFVEVNTPKKNSENILLHGVESILTRAKVSPKTATEVQMEQKMQSMEQELAREKRRLTTTDDVRDAVEYADNVLKKLQPPGPEDHHAEHKKSSWFRAAKAPTKAKVVDESWEHQAEAFVRNDPEVGAAQKQLAVWQNAAIAFLVATQTKDALTAYHRVLAVSMTDVNESITA